MGSEEAVKKAGKLKLQGKNYEVSVLFADAPSLNPCSRTLMEVFLAFLAQVEDGDIIFFKFNT